MGALHSARNWHMMRMMSLDRILLEELRMKENKGVQSFFLSQKEVGFRSIIEFE